MKGMWDIVGVGLVQRQTARAVITSIVASGISNLAILGILGMNQALSSAYFFVGVLGHALGYVLDLIFAKKSFLLHPEDEIETEIPYKNVLKRIILSWDIIKSPSTFRVVTVAVLDSVVGSILFFEMLRLATPFWTGGSVSFSFRNTVLSMTAAITTFFAFTNYLRFEWAYKSSPDSTITVIVTAWTVLSLVMWSLLDAVRSTCGSV